jgi:hypothetical protein
VQHFVIMSTKPACAVPAAGAGPDRLKTVWDALSHHCPARTDIMSKARLLNIGSAARACAYDSRAD